MSKHVNEFMRTDVLETTRLNHCEQWREGGSNAVGTCLFGEWVFWQTSNRVAITYVWKLYFFGGKRDEQYDDERTRTCSSRINACEFATEFAKDLCARALRFGHFSAFCLPSQRGQPRKRKRDYDDGYGEHCRIIAPALRRKRLAFAVPRSDEPA